MKHNKNYVNVLAPNGKIVRLLERDYPYLRKPPVKFSLWKWVGCMGDHKTKDSIRFYLYHFTGHEVLKQCTNCGHLFDAFGGPCA